MLICFFVCLFVFLFALFFLWFVYYLLSRFFIICLRVSFGLILIALILLLLTFVCLFLLVLILAVLFFFVRRFVAYVAYTTLSVVVTCFCFSSVSKLHVDSCAVLRHCLVAGLRRVTTSHAGAQDDFGFGHKVFSRKCPQLSRRNPRFTHQSPVQGIMRFRRD